MWHVTAKEKLLEQAPRLTEVQAEAALRVIEAQIKLDEYFNEESRLSVDERKAREDRWAAADARALIHEEPW